MEHTTTNSDITTASPWEQIIKWFNKNRPRFSFLHSSAEKSSHWIVFTNNSKIVHEENFLRVCVCILLKFHALWTKTHHLWTTTSSVVYKSQGTFHSLVSPWKYRSLISTRNICPYYCDIITLICHLLHDIRLGCYDDVFYPHFFFYFANF